SKAKAVSCPRRRNPCATPNTRRACPRSPPSSQAKRTRAMRRAPGQGAQLDDEPKRLLPGANGRHPVPLKLMSVGLLTALLVTMNVPGRVPKPSGRKLTTALQEACAGSDAG